ncbi:ABC transporter ATP-binding protein [Streptomyces sp. NBC_01481]|uniref:ABC transporter ATP-binding protein n=1 Tax=Streptomyces sp. NBC_01481 TaxID=2975869 RepID=UPI00225425C0|nr:ABC transporter ATP-binding protein [Streptomyces sp. NBC_01481]MCX4587276.1 ABC transporter ATP-binding protein/permease [Streptomyces sp. NBC_01481]
MTGGVLVLHDATVSSADVAHLVRRAVALVAESVGKLVVGTDTVTDGSTRPPKADAPAVSRGTASGIAVAGGAAAVLAVGARTVLNKSLLAFGGVVTATALIIRRAWRRSVPAREHADDGEHERASHPLLRIVGRHRPRLVLASVLSAVCQITEMALSLFIGWIAVVLIKGESALLTRMGLVGAATQLWFLAGVTALVCLAVAGLSYASGMEWRGLGQAVQHDWRNETYAHVQHLELRHLEGERTTRIAGALTDDVNQLGNFFAHSANEVVQIVTSFLVLVPVFLTLAPQIAWIAFLPVPIVAWLSFHYHDRVAADYAVSNENRTKLHSRLVNSLEASATVKSFCAEDYEAERIRDLSETYRRSNHRTDRSTVQHTENVRVCTTASMAGMMLLGGRAVLNGTLCFEVFSPLIGLPQQVLWRLTRLGGTVDQYQRTLVAFDRVERLRGLPVEPDGNGKRLDPRDVSGDIVLDQVTFAYPGRPPALENLSLRIAPGRVTGIVGATGSGKTTVAKLIMRFQDAGSGRVLIDGQDICDLPRKDVRRAVGFVAQDPFLFDGTVEENIRYGTFDATHDRVVEAARMAEAHGFIEAMPMRYDTPIGERGAALSGGQRQRIALARAILKDSPVVILDEATSAVDNETEAAIQRALKVFAADRTLVVIAHRLSTIRQADWIHVLDKGGVVAEEGTHADLLGRDGLYASLWQLQAGDKVA